MSNPAAPPSVAPTGPEDGLVQLAEAIDEMLWMWDSETGRVLYANSAFERFCGRSAADLGPGPGVLLEVAHPEDAERMRQARSRLPRCGYSEEYRVVLPAAERESRTARLRERALVNNGTRVIHVARDISWQFDTTAQLRAEISRRTDAERNLTDATARLHALIATANDGVITIDERSKILDWNHAAERMFGYTRAEAVGRTLTELIIPAAYRQQHDAGIARFLAEGASQLFDRRVEARALRRNGEEFDAELSIWPVRTASGYTFSSFVRDISRRKAAARALAESEAKYRKVVENVSEGILVTAAGRILYANPKGLAITGLDEATALSKPFIEFIHPDDRERVMTNHMKRLRGEPVENYYQFRVLQKDGSARWLEISAVVFEWQGAPATLNFLTDVTQRRQAEEDMRKALMRERDLSELKSRFVAMASHEFRTPLAAILSSVELLDDYGTRLPEEERHEIVGLVKNAVARMNGMIEKVLLASRLESGRFVFQPAPRAVPLLLTQVATELGQATAQAERIVTECCELEQPRLVDAQLLRHILVNLLGNALKYSPPDAPIRCLAKTEGEQLHLEVQDRGIGIPGEDLPRIFETFHRGTNVGNIQGTGMGLHIVRECVQLHGGTVDVQSEPGRGTTFSVRLHAPMIES